VRIPRLQRLPPRSRGRRNGGPAGTDPWTPPDNHAPEIGGVNCEKSQLGFQNARPRALSD
jgi:hypothetical protein